MKSIDVHGARVHNLKNVSVTIPRNKLVVITGPSGSGKSSLAFDTIYAEGQRRYIESLSSYARQFLGQMDPPDVDSITGLSPAIAIDQKQGGRNPRSTVGTVTEIFDYLRVLYARVGDAHCPESGDLLKAQTAEDIVKEILSYPEKTKIHLMSPIINNQKGEHKELLDKFQAQGFARVRYKEEVIAFDELPALKKTMRHTVDLVVDRLVMKSGIRSRLTDSVELALKHGDGMMRALIQKPGSKEELYFFSEHFFSPTTNKNYPPLEPRLFSFNSPVGACEKCSGLGVTKDFDLEKIIPDSSLSLKEGGIVALGKKGGFYYQMIASILKEEGESEEKPIKKWKESVQKIIFEGSSKVYTYKFTSESSRYEFKKAFPGLVNWLNRKYVESSSEKVRSDLEKMMTIEKCRSCEGHRLSPYPLNVLIKKKNIMEVGDLPLDEAEDFFKKLKFTGIKKIVADKLLKEINARLNFLTTVGLEYLTLNRMANTLSGGESQRIRLATQIGSALSGVIYVLDEPSIGLHQRDNQRLIETLKKLRELDNTVIVVEHDEETMLNSDYLIDMGPKAGEFGGDVVASGTPKQILRSKTVTAEFLARKRFIPLNTETRTLKGEVKLKGITKNNLANVNVTIPLNGLVGICGVSGSGKSTLVHQALAPAVEGELKGGHSSKACYQLIEMIEPVQQVVKLDQSPIGRTPKSNPATYTKLFDEIRKLFASTNDSNIRGYGQGRFSFNVKGGRCETCEGAGVIKVEMNFLPDVFIKCSDCDGKRYNKETLAIQYRGKNIAEVLEMTLSEALEFFQHHPKIKKSLQVLNDVGLGYIRLGQSSTTLSGGEAQRLKLSRELQKGVRGNTLYILDEPTTGLHFEDIEVLLKALNALVDKGNSVVVIEHNLDVLKACDYLIDMGPEGGRKGGKVVATGHPEKVSKSANSVTGKYLAPIFKEQK